MKSNIILKVLCVFVSILLFISARSIASLFYSENTTLAQAALRVAVLTVVALTAFYYYSVGQAKYYLRVHGRGLLATEYLPQGIYFGKYAGKLGFDEKSNLFELTPAEIKGDVIAGKWHGSWSEKDVGSYDVRGCISNGITLGLTNRSPENAEELAKGCYFNWVFKEDQWLLAVHTQSKKIISNGMEYEEPASATSKDQQVATSPPVVAQDTASQLEPQS